MTTIERNALKRDLKTPEDLFTLVAENNASALSNAFQAWGYSYSASSPREMVNELVRMYEAGGQPRTQAIALVGGVSYRFGVFPAGFDEVITGQSPPPALKSTDGGGDTSGEWYTDMNWSGIIDSIFGGVSNLTGGGNDSGYRPSGPGPAPTPNPNPGPADYMGMDTTTWAIIAVGVVIALVLLLKK